LPSIFSCSCREVSLADTQQDLLQRPLPDGIVPAEEVARTEKRWLTVMVAMLIVMMAVVVLTGVTNAIHPPSNVETIDPTTLHLGGEFAESNLGTAQEPDGSLTARLVADQYAFVPDCVKLAVDTPVKFRLTSTDVIHGFLMPATNVNTMVVPGFVAEVRTRFSRPGIYRMPCNEFCGNGHHGMWARVSVVPKEQFPALAPTERSSCVQQ
jgi:cytochrome c oxidase subunit II